MRTRNAIVLPLLLLLLGACALEPREGHDAENEEFLRNAYVAPVGIQNFRQFVASRVVISGVPLTPDSPMRGVYLQSQGLFSMDGDALSASSPMVMAMGSLSASFCDAAHARDMGLADGQRLLFRHVPSSGSFSGASRSRFAAHLFRRALQREPSGAEKAVLTTLLGASLSGGATVRQAAVAACAAVLSSLESWTR